MAALEEAGLATNVWIAFRHDNDDDDPGDHMHIAAVAADLEGNPPPRFLSTALAVPWPILSPPFTQRTGFWPHPIRAGGRFHSSAA